MPDKTVKELYMGKSLGELNQYVEIKLDNDASKICKSAARLFKSAETIRNEGDEEKSYVLYMRYIFTALHVNALPAYRRDKKFYDNMIGKNTVESARKWSEKLSSSLEKRYEILRQQQEAHSRLQQKRPSHTDRSDLVPSLKDLRIDVGKSPLKPVVKSVITNVPLPEECKGGISCSKLYEMLHDKCVHLLVMDARSSEDYAASHIKHPSCINIPAEIIKPGLSAPKLERDLPQASMALWTTRGSVDIIVLLDWTSSIETPLLGTELYSLKRAIYEWDTTTVLRSEPLVLSGGYDAWLNYYPTCTTNSHVQRPKHNSDLAVDSVLLDFDYPDLDNAFMETPMNSPEDGPQKTVIKKVVFSANGDIMAPNDLGAVRFKHPSVDRTTKPKVILNGVSIPSNELDNVSSSNSSIDKPSTDGHSFKAISKDNAKPRFDRAIKPRIGSLGSSKSTDDPDFVQDHVIRDREVTDAGLQLEKERLKYEMQIESLRVRREMEAEEGMKLELQNQETILLEKIDILEEEHRKIGADRDAVREENAMLKLKLDEMTKQSNEQAVATRDEIKRIKSHEQERLRLEKEVNRLRLERTMKGSSSNIIPEDTRPPSLPTEAPSHSSKSFSRPLEVKQSASIGGGGGAANIGFERLNSEIALSRRESFANRGLSRSQSFPNLSQVLENDVSSSDDVGGSQSTSDSTKSGLSEFATPLVNRSVKPSAAELSAASNRNLMPVFGGQGRALTGLRNMGNSCYMNSVIQCLSSTRELANYFITRSYKGDINRNNVYGHPGILVEEFAAIVQALYAGQYRCVTPRDLKKVVSKYQKLFEGGEQQDAQELLTFLMEYLHEDLNRSNKNKAKALHKEMKSLEDSALPIETVGQKYWEFESLLNNSIFVDLFQGQFKSTVTCCQCHKESVKFDTFSCISLPIPPGRGHCNLRDCLQLFRKEEKMTGSSKWKCPRCKELREAIKKIDIYRLPHILLIHLKRFFYEGVWRRKLETHIDFPLAALDMRDYVVGPKDRPLFDLYAVTNHYGTLDGGHYTAFCRNVFYNKWFKFDDHEVNEISASNIQSPAAYILYYTSKNPVM